MLLSLFLLACCSHHIAHGMLPTVPSEAAVLVPRLATSRRRPFQSSNNSVLFFLAAGKGALRKRPPRPYIPYRGHSKRWRSRHRPAPGVCGEGGRQTTSDPAAGPRGTAPSCPCVSAVQGPCQGTVRPARSIIALTETMNPRNRRIGIT